MTSDENDDDRRFDPTANSWYSPVDQSELAVVNQSASQESIATEPSTLLFSIYHASTDAHEPAVVPPRQQSDPHQRQFSRVSLLTERTPGTFSVNGRSYPCRLVEMSIGGFGVLIAHPPFFKPGSIGSLRANGLNYIVSVTRTETRDSGGYVGLKQIEEVVESNRSLPGEPMSILAYTLAGLAVGLIITISMLLMRSL